MITRRIGIDLGTSQTRIYHPRKGIVISEPTVVATNVDRGEIEAVGAEALEMIGRTPESIAAYYPLKDGVIADFRVTQKLLKYFVQKAIGRMHLRSPEIMLSVSSGATSTERRAALDAARGSGSQQVHIIQSSVAAALGAAVPINLPTGNLVIDIGAGTTEIAVISLSGIVSQNSIRVGGKAINDNISSYIRHKYGLSIGGQTAEEVKHILGSALPVEKPQTMTVPGRDLIEGLPKRIEIDSNELVPSIEEVLEKIVFAIRSVIEKTPPELVSDIIDHGITLTGGGAQLNNLDNLLAKIINVPVTIAQDAPLCVAKGTGIALTNLEDYRRSSLGIQ